MDEADLTDEERMAESGNGRALEWFRVLEEGHVTTVHAGLKKIALVHHEGKWAALDNRCPHQGGPLGEGSIENGLLRCPWHGYDYDPLTGGSPGEFVDTATCGALGTRVTEASQLDDAIERALAHDGPAMVEVVADAELV